MNSDEYFRFRVEDRKSTNIYSTLVKVLIILILSTILILLSIWGYKTLIGDDIAKAKSYQKISLKTPTKQSLKKEELALIVKAVLEQMQKKQENISDNKISDKKTSDKKTSEDSELLSSLQSVKVDKIEKKPKKKIEEKKKKNIEKLVYKKVDKVIKKKITKNVVVIGHKQVNNLSDLARLYASINKVSKKKKRKLLKSAYTKKITKEIVIRKNAMRSIKVRKGDTLSSIAQRAYGKSSMYKKIFNANPDLLNNPNNLRIGQILRVPK